MSVDVIDSYTESIERIQPDQANNYGNAHGGTIVRLMDELAAVSAMKVARETCVTARISDVAFENPVPVGHVLEMSAFVYDTGTTSLEVTVTAESRDPRDTEPQRTTAACFTMVAVNESGKPVAVPAVEANTERGDHLINSSRCL